MYTNDFEACAPRHFERLHVAEVPPGAGPETGNRPSPPTVSSTASGLRVGEEILAFSRREEQPTIVLRRFQRAGAATFRCKIRALVKNAVDLSVLTFGAISVSTRELSISTHNGSSVWPKSTGNRVPVIIDKHHEHSVAKNNAFAHLPLDRRRAAADQQQGEERMSQSIHVHT